MKQFLRKARFLAVILAAVMVVAFIPVQSAVAAAAAREFVQIGQSLGHTGIGEGAEPGYTFESSLLSNKDTVGAMVFNISIDLPLEGDVAWNDWCGEVLSVTANGETKFYDFGGKEVGWGNDDIGTGGKDSDTWVGFAANGIITVSVPVNASDFSIDFYDNCWDNDDNFHYTINSAIALYGNVAGVEHKEIGQEITYTGVGEGFNPGYEFVSSAFSTKGNIAAVAFNINIALPLEGDVAWNDWCGEVLSVTANGETKFYDFGGKEVGWGNDDIGTGGKDSDTWVGFAENGALSILVPVDAEDFSVAFYDNCWDSDDGIHYVINYATALFGSVVEGTAPAMPEKPAIPAFDPDGTYNAYLGVQMNNWFFRNGWADEHFGANGKSWDDYDGNYFDRVFHGDSNGPKPGVFTDAEIKGNGTYRVSLVDYDFENADVFNQLFVSTDIPLEGENLTFTDIKVIIGGSSRYTFEEGYIYGVDNNDERDYYEIYCISAWNGDLKELFNDMVPTGGEIAVEFTVSGFNYDKTDDSVLPDNSNNVSSEQNTPMPTPEPDNSGDGFPGWVVPAIIIGIVVIGAATFIVIKKKKS